MDVRDSIKEIPLYQEILDAVDLGEGLESFPNLNKKVFIKNFPLNIMTPKLKQAMKDNGIEYNSTSGTSGERLQIIRKIDWWEEEEQRIAPYTYLWGKHLQDLVYSRAVLTTPMCSNTVCFLDNPPYESRILGNKLYLNTSASPDLWRREDVERIVREIDLFQPMHVHADPVYLALFMLKINEYGLEFPQWKPNFLSLSFEFVPMSCRSFIQRYWDVPTFTLYGLTELGYLFCECENGKLHWCEPLNELHFSLLEGREGVYNLVVTSVKNEYMPFVRYETNDLFLICQEKERTCSCSHPSKFFVEKALGRKSDITQGVDSQLITLGEFDEMVSNLQTTVLLYQLDLSLSDSIIFRYMSCDFREISAPQKKAILGLLEKLYGGARSIQVLRVASMKPSPSGKFSLIKQEVV